MYTDPETEARWDAWERRNPGVEHPDRTRHKREQRAKIRSQQYEEATETFRPALMTIAERQAASRRQQRGF